jgi:amidohydrolase
MALATAKQRLADEVDRRADVLIDAAHQIHAHPELGFEEVFAHDLLTGIIEADGLEPERGAYGLPTAFRAAAGTTGPTVAVCCEYDALPVVGHACGHNIIATAGLGAGLAAAALADELGGRVVILGTPAEEGGGGKIMMIDAGAFTEVDAAMMVHPAGADLRGMTTIAVQQLWVEYHGQEAHAAAFPFKGRNALDAAVLGYNAVAALRQHLRPEERVHGIFTKAGEAANVVPGHTAAVWYVRAKNLRRLEQLKPRVFACLQAGADAAGCTMTYDWKEPVFADMVDNEPFADLYVANAATVGRTVLDPRDGPMVVGSTDMGNVSYEVPSIHPMIKVAPANVSIHSPEFTQYACSADGDQAVLDGAKAMAMTIADLWLQPEVLERVAEAFAASEASASAAGSVPAAPSPAS